RGSDAALAGAAGQVGDDDEGRAGEGVGFFNLCLSAIGEAKAATRPGRLGNSIREGAGQVIAGSEVFAWRSTSQLCPAAGHGAGVVGTFGPVGAEALEAASEVDI